MATVVLAGTVKGALVLRGDADRQRFEASPLLLPGWIVTASTRDDTGRFYVAVTHDVYGAAILCSDDLEHFEQLEAAPRFEPGKRGNESHLRISGATDPMGRFKDGGRYVDQIWKLHSCGGALYAGVSEAGAPIEANRGSPCLASTTTRIGRGGTRGSEACAPTRS